METVQSVVYGVAGPAAGLAHIVLPAVFVAAFVVGGLLLYKYAFKQAEEPPMLAMAMLDARTRKKDKKKPQTKKSANGQAVQDGEAKKKSADAKVSPKKEKVKEAAQEKKKAKEAEKPAKKEKTPEVKEPEKKTPKKEKKKVEKPADYDEGEWEKVPTKNEKKKKAREEPKDEEKVPKESPSKDKREKRPREAKKETVTEQKKETKREEPKTRPAPAAEMRQALSPDIQEKINELQRVLNEVEQRDRSQTPVKFESSDSAPPTPDPKKTSKANNAEGKENVKPPKKEESKEKANSPPKDDNLQFDELGDTWTEAKAPKKGKKKVRKDQ